MDFQQFLSPVHGYTSEAALLDAYEQDADGEVWAGVVFMDEFVGGWPADITYKLRVSTYGQWDTDSTYPFISSFGFRNNNTYGGSPGNETCSLLLLYFGSAHLGP